ncbi:olfactory receptor 476-like [Mauremys mutica]|uniref:olfactory receptor 476-like n=1 Tax=Mauremys mutica TaxID=74926 RepID=UPI001D162F25|nr:olfactory receptor 476-like [Mauremys mutica]
MSYDRYLAICKPLYYTTRMNDRFCLQLAIGSWVSGSLAIATLTVLLSQLTFCDSNGIDYFFCDFTPIVKLACSDTHLLEVTAFVSSSIFTLPPFLLTLASYIHIIAAILLLRIPSTTGRQKAFSTCSSHLSVVTIYYGSLIIVYMLPDSNRLRSLNKVFSGFYTILTPLVNPLIYSLRNNAVKEALWKALSKLVPVTRI